MHDQNLIKWYSTIRTKVILTIVVTVTLVLGIAGFIASRYIEQRETNALQELAEVSATRLSQHLSPPMWNVDQEQVTELLVAELTEQRISVIVVRDEDKKSLFAAKERLPNGSIAESNGDITGNYISVSRDIDKDNNSIGEVSIHVSRSYLEQDLVRFRQIGFALILTLIVTIIIVMVIVLGNQLITPLKSISKAAERMSKGDLNQSLDIHSNDEIGALAHNFRLLQSSLKIAMKRLMDRSSKQH